jgi:O-antigen/teichoic acid export membrane protein
VQRRDLDEDQIARLGGLALLIGIALCAVSVAIAQPVALAFGERAVRQIVMLLSLTFVTTALQVLPRSLLARDLQFRRLAWMDGAEAVANTAATLALAFLGFRYWALVLGSLVATVVSTVLCYIWRPHRLALPRRFYSISSAVTFGWHLVVSRLAWYVYSNADFAIVGRLLGKGPLGEYTFGWEIASIPVERVSAMVGRVTPAVFAAVQDDVAALRRYLLGLTEGLALITFPASVGLALVADEFVLVALGEKWRGAIIPLRLLAFYAGFRSVSTLFAQILIVRGETKRNMQFSILTAVVLPVVFFVGARWGTTGVAMGWIIGYPLVVIPFYFRFVFRTIDLRARDYLRALWPALSGSAAVAAVVLLVDSATPATWHLGLRLGTQVLAGVAAYVTVLWFGHRERVERIRSMLKDIRG